jgi:hypothetical protein
MRQNGAQAHPGIEAEIKTTDGLADLDAYNGVQYIPDMNWVHYNILGEYLDDENFLVGWVCPTCGVHQSGLPGLRTMLTFNNLLKEKV